jgi:hypothetical protein
MLERTLRDLAAPNVRLFTTYRAGDFRPDLVAGISVAAVQIPTAIAYAQLAGMTGHAQDAARYRKIAQEFAGKWSGLAAEGDHYKLAFDTGGGGVIRSSALPSDLDGARQAGRRHLCRGRPVPCRVYRSSSASILTGS